MFSKRGREVFILSLRHFLSGEKWSMEYAFPLCFFNDSLTCDTS